MKKIFSIFLLLTLLICPIYGDMAMGMATGMVMGVALSDDTPGEDSYCHDKGYDYGEINNDGQVECFDRPDNGSSGLNMKTILVGVLIAFIIVMVVMAVGLTL